MTGPSIRPADSGDAPAIARIQAASWQTTYRGLLPATVLEQMTEEKRTPVWEQTLAAGTTVLLACEGGDPVAFCAVADRGDTGEITAMYALEAAQGRGHGRRLMEAALAWFRDRDHASVHLWVLDTNELGRAFYTGAGWEPDGVTSDDEVFGSRVPHVRYTIDL